MNDLTKVYDIGRQSDMIFMDIAKAFDTVPYNRLKLKLEWYGVIGNILQGISSFLSDHYQKVVIENISTSVTSVTSSVPQGTVLGPILFHIYFNDIVDHIKHGTIRLFADDIVLYKQVLSLQDAKNLQSDLASLQEWEKVWLLKFNISKCCVLKVTRAVTHKIDYQYLLHQTHLTEVSHCKYLGIMISGVARLTMLVGHSLGHLTAFIEYSSALIEYLIVLLECIDFGHHDGGASSPL